MWGLLVAILEVLMAIDTDADAMKPHARADLLPDYRAFKQAQQVEQAQSAAAEAEPTPTSMKRPATRRRMSKRTRRTAAHPHA
jgi:hypothetical protein